MRARHPISQALRFAAALFAGALSSAAVMAAGAGPVDPVALPIQTSGFSLKLPKAETVAYRGMVSFDAAGGKDGVILYPGYAGIAGLLVGIATHGALVEAGKSSEKTKLQETADKVLDPFKDAIGSFTNRDLMQQGMTRLNAGTNKLLEAADTGEGWVVESLPVFSMTQDLSALVLENAVSIYSASDPTTIRYRNVIKIVSNVQDDADLQALWNKEDGKLLKEESVGLFAHSLKLVLQAAGTAPGEEAKTERTIRYSEGKEQRMERAQLIRVSCGRAVIKTLRGWLMSVPLRQASEPPAPECSTAERYPA